MESHTWAFLKWGLSILVASIGIWHRHSRWRKNKAEITSKDPKIDVLNYVFYEPLVFGLLMYIATAVTEIKFVNFSDFMDGRKEINVLAKNLNKTYDGVGNNKILASILNDKISTLNRFAVNATGPDKDFIVSNSNDFIPSAKKIFELADPNSTILATSYVNKDNWWYTIQGKEYLKYNYDFIRTKRGTIKRIHIFANDDEYNFYKELMRDEKKNGIDVNFVYVNEIPKELNYNLKQDIILLGRSLAGKLELNDERVPQLIHYYASEERVAEYNDIFLNLQKYSTVFK
jgi:hypothetical protein